MPPGDSEFSDEDRTSVEIYLRSLSPGVKGD